MQKSIVPMVKNVCIAPKSSIGAMIPIDADIMPPISGPAYGMTFITPIIKPMSRALSVFIPMRIITVEITIISMRLSVSMPVK